MPFRLPAAFGFIASVLLTCCAPALGQASPSEPKRVAALARFVPASTPLFISVRRLDDVDAALQRAHAWPFLPWMTGAAPASDGGLRSAVESFLGPRHSVDLKELFTTEVGIASSSWQSLDVWLARLPRPDSAERWFPVDRRTGGGAAVGRGFRMDSGLLVCVKDDVAAMGRRGLEGASVRDVVALMTGTRGDALAQEKTYQDLTSYLPARPLAVAYWSPTASESTLLAQLIPDFERMVVAMYESDGRLDFAVRASLPRPYSSEPLSVSAIQRLLRLPRTTIFAHAAHFDFDKALESAAKETPAGKTWMRYLTLLGGLGGASDGQDAEEPMLGPEAIAVWGQDLSEVGSTPQLALLIEHHDADSVKEAAARWMQRAMTLLQALDPQRKGEPLAVRETSHLGTTISHVSLKSFADTSTLPAARLLARLEPSWAVSDEWLIVALTRAHVERILDGQFGLISTLDGSPEVRTAVADAREYTMVSVMQAGLASQTLRRWISSFESGAPSLLNPDVWISPIASRPTGKQQHFGIGMRSKQESGVVVVARIAPGSPADGPLRVDDRIIGVDGELLGLDGPNAGLRRKLAESKTPDGPRLRILRDDQIIEVVLPKEPPPGLTARRPADLVRELAALTSNLDFAGFAVLASDEPRYSARVSLRFAPVATGSR